MYSFVDVTPERDLEMRRWEVFANGAHPEWTLYELLPMSSHHARGPTFRRKALASRKLLVSTKCKPALAL